MNRLFLAAILCAILAEPALAQTIQVPIQTPIQNPMIRCIQQPGTCGDFPQIYGALPANYGGQPLIIRTLQEPAVVSQPVSDYGDSVPGLDFGTDSFPTW